MRLIQRRINANHLELIAPADSFADPREPPLVLGNLVRLNSGGPTMVVVDIEDGPTAICAWRDGDGKTHECCFPVACIHRVSSSFASAGSAAPYA